MYPLLTQEMMAGALEIMCYVSTVAAALISCLVTMRF
jgi:hypothetical protein